MTSPKKPVAKNSRVKRLMLGSDSQWFPLHGRVLAVGMPRLAGGAKAALAVLLLDWQRQQATRKPEDYSAHVEVSNYGIAADMWGQEKASANRKTARRYVQAIIDAKLATEIQSARAGGNFRRRILDLSPILALAEPGATSPGCAERRDFRDADKPGATSPSDETVPGATSPTTRGYQPRVGGYTRGQEPQRPGATSPTSSEEDSPTLVGEESLQTSGSAPAAADAAPSPDEWEEIADRIEAMAEGKSYRFADKLRDVARLVRDGDADARDSHYVAMARNGSAS